MADYYDFLGNKVNIGDLIVYPDSDGMPHTSHIEKLTDTRYYFSYTFYGRQCSEERLGYRSPSQIISLSALKVKKEDVAIYWKSSKDNKDMTGRTVTEGAKVAGQVEKKFCLGEVLKINKQTCRVKYSESGKEKNEYTTHLLILQ
ncbi:MAG: hypothetical protein IKH13_09060 [Clostridia bacterium]|nr:hypothetical protein [Clostridia bacterium]